MPTKHGKADKGSQKWLQILVNDCPELLNREIAEQSPVPADGICWLSPIQATNYWEYRDQAFIDRLQIQLDKYPLKSFWPKKGPQWDALGKANNKETLIVEAKSHIGELGSKNSTGSQASEKSLKKIRSSLDLTKNYIGTTKTVDWAKSRYYQYANRLAHLYLLRVLNDLPAYLITLYFLNDEEMGGPSTIAEWESAIADEHQMLGIPSKHQLDKYIIPAFVDIRDIPVK